MALTSKQKDSIEVACGSKDGDQSISKAIAGASAQADIAVVSTADAVDAATAIALVNELKAKINAMLNAAKNA